MLRARKSRQRCSAIWLTRICSWVLAGWWSSCRADFRDSKASGSSPGIRICLEVRPCLVALCLMASMAACDLGPVECCAFAALAARCFRVLIGVYLPGYQFGCWGIGGVLRFWDVVDFVRNLGGRFL